MKKATTKTVNVKKVSEQCQAFFALRFYLFTYCLLETMWIKIVGIKNI